MTARDVGGQIRLADDCCTWCGHGSSSSRSGTRYHPCSRGTSCALSPLPKELSMAADPIRTLRVDAKLWQEASAAAKERGETLSEAIRRFLRGYVRRTQA